MARFDFGVDREGAIYDGRKPNFIIAFAVAQPITAGFFEQLFRPGL
jgi:hypothetical protein